MKLREKKILKKYQFWRDLWGKELSIDPSLKILCGPCSTPSCGCETGCSCKVGCGGPKKEEADFLIVRNITLQQLDNLLS